MQGAKKVSLPQYAFFDMDGTVVAKDSFQAMLKAFLRKSPLRALPIALFSPIFLYCALFKPDKRWPKSLALWSITVGKGRRKILQELTAFAKAHGESHWFPEASQVIAVLRKQGIQIVYISASGQYWVRQLVNHMDPEAKIVIGSQLRLFLGGVVFAGPNCYDTEKVSRIATRLGTELIVHSGWTDHPADIPMLHLATHKNVICPKLKHMSHFEKAFGVKGFSLHQWTSLGKKST